MESASKQFRKRNAILACLQQTKAHPSAEVLHQMLTQEHPDISLATVYRNLALFKRQGSVVSLGTVDGIERFDADTRPHDHFVCSCCGAVQDLPQRQSMQQLCGDAASELGCRIDGYQLMFSGVCRECLSNCGTDSQLH